MVREREREREARRWKREKREERERRRERTLANDEGRDDDKVALLSFEARLGCKHRCKKKRDESCRGLLLSREKRKRQRKKRRDCCVSHLQQAESKRRA